jgi:hypothetical protein
MICAEDTCINIWELKKGRRQQRNNTLSRNRNGSINVLGWFNGKSSFPPTRKLPPSEPAYPSAYIKGTRKNKPHLAVIYNASQLSKRGNSIKRPGYEAVTMLRRDPP